MPRTKAKRPALPISAGTRAFLAEQLEAVGGAEILVALTVDAATSHWESPRVLARGNHEAAPAILRGLRPGDILLHNHPSGLTTPSDADLDVAGLCGRSGIGFAITDNDLSHTHVVVEPALPTTTRQLNADELAKLIAPGGSVAQTLSAHEARPGQIAMLRAVVEAFNHPHHAILEGGTGIGKSLAYLVPAIAWAVHNKCRVAISTNTINLQHQLFHKDLPLLARALPWSFKAELLKGRSNYLCRRRLDDMTGATMGETLLDPDELEPFRGLLAWAEKTADGTLSDLAQDVPDSLWEKVQADKDSCLGIKCRRFRDCFLFAARRRAAESDIMVVNHHLLFADLALRRETGFYDQTVVIPSYAAIVFDEAHNLEDAATSHFGERTSAYGVNRMLGRLLHVRGPSQRGILPILAAHVFAAKFIPEGVRLQVVETLRTDLAQRKTELAALADQFFDQLATICIDGPIAVDRVDRSNFGTSSTGGSGRRRGEQKLRITDEIRTQSWFTDLVAQADALRDALRRMMRKMKAVRDRLAEIIPDDADDATLGPMAGTLAEFAGAMNRLKALGDAVQLFFSPKDDEQLRDYVHFLTVTHGRRGQPLPAFQSLPIVTGRLLNEACFAPLPTVICASATLTVASGFAFLRERIGLIDDPERHPTVEGVFSSPFDYPQQARLYAPTDLPAPNDPRFLDSAAPALAAIIGATMGGALVLCTSYSHLTGLAERLEPALSSLGLTVFRQGDMDRHALLEEFRDDGNAVLFATDSFWEGIDIPGRALRNVIITKLPFAVPDDPVLSARQERLEQDGRDPFFDYQVPMAALKLKQGFGRLIRHRSDRGIAWILDHRIVTKQYGRQFVQSLPPAARRKGPWRALVAEAETFMGSVGPRIEARPDDE